MLALLGVIQLLRLPSVGECLLVYDSVSSSELCSPFLFETNRSSALAGTNEGLLLSYFFLFLLAEFVLEVSSSEFCSVLAETSNADCQLQN